MIINKSVELRITRTGIIKLKKKKKKKETSASDLDAIGLTIWIANI